MWTWRPQTKTPPCINIKEKRNLSSFAYILKTTAAEYERVAESITQTKALEQFTQEHQHRILRFLPFAFSEQRAQWFEHFAAEMDWGPRTQQTYYGTILTTCKLTGKNPTVEDEAMMKIIHKRVLDAPIWDYEDRSKCSTHRRSLY